MRIEGRGLTVRYPGAPAPALEGVDISVAPGSLHAVLGPNGSGKSTLMRALLGVIALEEGEVRIGDRPLAGWRRRELAREVAAVAQSEAMPFPMTVRELVGMGRYMHLGPLEHERAEDRKAVVEALERCDAVHLADRAVQTLSGGELQRVRIARALAQHPHALILDEPTAALDIRHEMGILGVLRGATECGITVVWITHHLDLAARYADRILLLREGTVRARGTPEEVITAEHLERVYGWPIAVAPDPHTGTPRITPLDPAARG
ncbi:MAG: ABC transporter ATP-binding protein [Longimicrobiales bacterium]|nr:ABC transporter ATP-binding protein [Longimicrobiales bacterium]